MMHSIFIIGQSNMAGRGYKSEVPPIANDRLFVLRNGRQRPMYVPVNPDRETAEINLFDDALYVKTDGGIYKRELCSACTVSDAATRKAVGYYD